jgi:hypothetical protein
MTAGSLRSSFAAGGGARDLGDAVRAEWIKLRTVRGWLLGLTLAAAVLVLFAYLTANGQHSGICGPGPAGSQQCGAGHPRVPVGPDGEPVADSYYLVGQRLSGNGTITARVTALTGVTALNGVSSSNGVSSPGSANAAPSLTRTRPGLAAWSKAGLMITAGTRQGKPYAAVMATPRHGVRFQYDYTHDAAGLTGAVSAASPRWLRLTRTGDTITAYDAAGGAHWHRIGETTLGRLPRTVDVGLFVTSPVTFNGSATRATARFDRVTLGAKNVESGWRGQGVGLSAGDFYNVLGNGDYHRVGHTFVVSGSGDIAAAVTASGDTAASILTQALIAALIVIVVVAAMFMTSEYRRGLIRTTLAAVPDRGRALAAKALVIGGVGFIVGSVAAAISIPLSDHVAATNGNYILPTGAITEARMIFGTGAIVAFMAVAVLATGAMLRRTAGTVLVGIVVFVLPAVLVVPYVSGTSTGSSPPFALWLLRLSPAAGFSILQSLPRSAQVSYPYTIGNGYLPLSPGVGLAVAAAWALVLVLLAARLLARRDP